MARGPCMVRSKASFVMGPPLWTNTTENNWQIVISKPRAFYTVIVFMNDISVVCQI